MRPTSFYQKRLREQIEATKGKELSLKDVNDFLFEVDCTEWSTFPIIRDSLIAVKNLLMGTDRNDSMGSWENKFPEQLGALMEILADRLEFETDTLSDSMTVIWKRIGEEEEDSRSKLTQGVGGNGQHEEAETANA